VGGCKYVQSILSGIVFLVDPFPVSEASYLKVSWEICNKEKTVNIFCAFVGQI